MAKVILVSLHCIRTEDWLHDECYLLVKGRRVWRGKINDGDTMDLTDVPHVRFEAKASIDLYDDDFPDRDDHLGTTYAYVGQAGNGEIEHWFAAWSAKYKLTFMVKS